MPEYTFKELEKMTCQSFGGNNCVLHGCMFDCQLLEAKKRALMKERGFTLNQANEYLKQYGSGSKNI